MNVFAETTLAPVMLPPLPDVEILPNVAFPDTFNVPVIFAPVPVITTTFAFPTALKLILPFALGMFILLFPFAKEPALIPVN